MLNACILCQGTPFIQWVAHLRTVHTEFSVVLQPMFIGSTHWWEKPFLTPTGAPGAAPGVHDNHAVWLGCDVLQVLLYEGHHWLCGLSSPMGGRKQLSAFALGDTAEHILYVPPLSARCVVMSFSINDITLHRCR